MATGFDTTRFQIFLIFRYLPIFHVFYLCDIITLLSILISHYWLSKYSAIDIIKMLEDIDYDFNGFDTTFSKNLYDFLKLS